jgi:hypothetical protein
MPGPPKGTPKPKGSGRKRRSVNKRTAFLREVAAARQAAPSRFKTLVAVEQMAIIAERFIDRVLEEEKKRQPNQSVIDEASLNAARVLKDLRNTRPQNCRLSVAQRRQALAARARHAAGERPPDAPQDHAQGPPAGAAPRPTMARIESRRKAMRHLRDKKSDSAAISTSNA